MSGDRLFHQPREIAELAPGATVVPDWLDAGEQKQIVAAFGEWCRGPVPLRAATLSTGHRMSAQTVCLGWHWWPYRYSRTADDVNGARVLGVPAWLGELARRALADTGWPAAAVEDYRPDVALANYYGADARMGLHQDKEEVVNRPVVSLSVGDTARFRFGNTQNRGKPYTDVELRSGDLLVFGGPSRFAFHGVTGILPGTGPAIGLGTGRINVTLRVTGLSDR